MRVTSPPRPQTFACLKCLHVCTRDKMLDSKPKNGVRLRQNSCPKCGKHVWLPGPPVEVRARPNNMTLDQAFALVFARYEGAFLELADR